MNVAKTPIEGVLCVEPRVFGDARGFFLETFHRARYRDVGIDHEFVQDNWSHSVKNTLRGLHFQKDDPQGKLVMAVKGTIWDVAVDIRRGSPTYGKWYGTELSGENRRQLWVPPGCAHGFCVLSESADVLYKCTSLYRPESDRSLAWNDPTLAVAWPVTDPLLSDKDRSAPSLAQLEARV